MTVDELETPAIIADLNIVEANVARMANYARQQNLALRPHTKTHKIPALAKLQVVSGCHGITVAKTGEAEVMANAGLDNILVAYPVFGEAKLERLAALALAARITVAVDSEVTIDAIAAAARRAHSSIDILVEVDVGMRRCGVNGSADALRLAQYVDGTRGVRFAGIMIYPGHIWVRPEEQAGPLRLVGEKLSEILALLDHSGLSCDVVSGGSTPTAMQSHLIPGLTEIRPGTYIFNDRNSLGVGACTLTDCALRVVSTVVSTAVQDRAIIDAGTKTLSSDRWLSGGSGCGLVVEHPEINFESMSEEHGHLNLSGSEYRPRIGDRVSIVPNHVCACVNLHNRIWYHRGGVVEGFWPVEGRGCVA